MSRIEDLVSEVLERNPDRVFLQLPEGLRTVAEDVSRRLGHEGIEAFVSLDPCYGACDIKSREARDLGCDLLVHVGHTMFVASDMDVLYFPWYHDVDPVPLLEENVETFGDFDSIGLVASVNFLPAIREAEEFLESCGFDVFVGEGDRTRRGQMLGCDVSAALEIEEKVDCYLYIGSGKFHVLGLVSEADRPVFVLDLEKGEVYEPDFDRFERQRIVAVEEAKDAEVFGILVSTKRGQSSSETASTLRKRIEDSGGEAHIFVMDEITPQKLRGIDVDCLVNTACPRISVEHRTDFGVPILNPREAEDIF